jgi:hypothetical protein
VTACNERSTQNWSGQGGSLITLATSLVAIASSKSITLELYKSHAKTKTGKVLPLD